MGCGRVSKSTLKAGCGSGSVPGRLPLSLNGCCLPWCLLLSVGRRWLALLPRVLHNEKEVGGLEGSGRLHVLLSRCQREQETQSVSCLYVLTDRWWTSFIHIVMIALTSDKEHIFFDETSALTLLLNVPTELYILFHTNSGDEVSCAFKSLIRIQN